MWALVDDNQIRFINELSDQIEIKQLILAQSIHYHSVGMVIALELHVHFRMNISFEVSIR